MNGYKHWKVIKKRSHFGAPHAARSMPADPIKLNAMS